MKVYIHVLTWNEKKYLPDFFESLDAQTYPDFTVRILDNGSTDDTMDYLRQHRPQTVVGRNVRNKGFAPGHNDLMRYTIEHRIDQDEDPFVLLAQPDMIFHPEVITKLAQALEADPELGAVQPKLYRAFGENVGDEILEETMKSDIIDTTGLRLHKSWRLTDRGAGELDQGQFDEQTKIIAPTGTMALFRLSTIQSLMIDGEFFDNDFHTYREDCDLALRFARAGWRAQFVPKAIAHHYRGMYGAEKQSAWARLKNRRAQRPFFAALSTRNQLFVLLKNLTWSDIFWTWPWLMFGEGTRVIYGILFEPETRARLFGMWKLARRMLEKRKVIQQNQQVSASKIRKYAQ